MRTTNERSEILDFNQFKFRQLLTTITKTTK